MFWDRYIEIEANSYTSDLEKGVLVFIERLENLQVDVKEPNT